MRLVMASANAHKAFEIAQILTDHEIQPRPDSLGEIVEDQERRKLAKLHKLRFKQEFGLGLFQILGDLFKNEI